MPKRVLVVDDDPVQRRALEDTIRRFGYTVATAETGDQAISVLRSDASGDISLILLDLAVPGSEGMAVLTALRSLPRKYPAIVQIADGNTAENRAALVALGFEAWSRRRLADQGELLNRGDGLEAVRTWSGRSRAGLLVDPSALGRLRWLVLAADGDGPLLPMPRWVDVARSDDR